jgi:hypothetical protein
MVKSLTLLDTDPDSAQLEAERRFSCTADRLEMTSDLALWREQRIRRML